MKKIRNIAMALGLLTMGATCYAEEWDTYPDTWVAVDELGRNVATSDNGVTRKAKDTECQLGMFYYLWHGQHESSGKDITELLKANPDNPAWGDAGLFHWGSKPWLGYYTAGDAYVLSRHLQMLCDAGVDFLYFDVTNAVTYSSRVTRLMAEIDRRAALGLKSPKLCFIVHSNARATTEEIYQLFYKWAKYDKYWFLWEGKPLLLGPKSEIAVSTVSGLVDKFTYRNSWAWMRGANKDEWSWLEFYPQAAGWTTDASGAKTLEQMSVSVAQHATSKVGKSYHGGKQPAYDKYGLCEETPQGLYFQEQWDRAISVHTPIVMVTQFNEWQAQRFVINSTSEYGNVRPGATAKIGETYFVDVYNQEFSRDLEPSADALIRDNYYLQLVSNVRKWRGVEKIPVPTVNKTIDVDGDFSQWNAETVEYRDDKGDCDITSASVQTAATLARATNDIIVSKVTQNDKNLYFYVKTLNDMSDFATSKLWMRLLLNTDTDYSTGWGGYDYMVYKDAATGAYSLMKNSGNAFAWTTVAAVNYRVEGNEMQLCIPKSSVGITGDRDIDFKWADNISDDNPDIMTFISDGDVAPNGRFNYRYKGASLSTSGIETVGNEEANFFVTANGGNVTFHYNGTDAQEAVISVYNMQGAEVKRIQNGIDATVELPKGVYMAKYAISGATGVKKFVNK